MHRVNVRYVTIVTGVIAIVVSALETMLADPQQEHDMSYSEVTLI